MIIIATLAMNAKSLIVSKKQQKKQIANPVLLTQNVNQATAIIGSAASLAEHAAPLIHNVLLNKNAPKTSIALERLLLKALMVNHASPALIVPLETVITGFVVLLEKSVAQKTGIALLATHARVAFTVTRKLL